MTRTMQMRLIGIAALTGLGVCGTMGEVNAAPQNEKMPMSNKMGKVSSIDKKFVMEAAKGGMAEVQLGQLASKKGTSDGVKQFGQHMVQDHSAANAELKQLASSKGIMLPKDVGPKHKADMARLSKLNGAAFDSAYIKHMTMDHEMDIKLFSKQAASGSDSDLKGFASKTLPTLKDHYAMIKEMKTNKGKMAHNKMKM